MKLTFRIISFAVISFAITGCASTGYAVYGKSGKSFNAPTLCGALVQCLNSSETSCYYDSTVMTDLNGKFLEQSSCKQVPKP